MITFCRVRPAAGVNEVWATTRRREGTNVLELEVLGSADRAGALAGGVLPVAGLQMAPNQQPGWSVRLRL